MGDLRLKELQRSNKLVEQIPKRAFVNAEIIREAEKSKDWKLANRVIKGKYGIDNYTLLDSAYIVSLMYCLLVVPKELWERKNGKHSIFNELDKMNLVSLFEINYYNENNLHKSHVLLRKLRNSISYANYSIDDNLNFIFWDKRDNKLNFEVNITRDNLMKFISEVGAILANSLG